jgi:nucleotide-binding universal stress UspA family protein
MELDTNAVRRGILVTGVDFSATSDRAVAAAFTLVRDSPGTDVHLVHVASSRSDLRAAPGPLPELLRLDEQLQRIAQRHFAATRSARPRIFTHLLLGNPPREIVQLATDVHAGLIVIGTNGQSPEKKLGLGSVADRVLRIASCSVLAVRPSGLSVSEHVEPPCPACDDVQKASPRAELWCERHEKKHTLSRSYFEEPQEIGPSSTV